MNQIFSNWNVMRVLRLALSIAVIIQAVATKDVAFGIAGVLLTGMTVLGIGCCGAQGCYTEPQKSIETEKEISYEEVV